MSPKSKLYPLGFLFFLLFGFQVCGQTIQTYEDGPVHEAFITRIAGNDLLDAVPFQPPAPVNERIPRQMDMQSEWIPGYWEWDEQFEDFTWVSGTWRRAPPGHQWISGFWQQYPEGWVRIPGFWSRSPAETLDYIGIAPPEPIDESMSPPPTSNYFWAPGFWYFLFDEQQYDWVPGHWEELDPHWVLVPSHYVWRPGGYVFVPSFWDWPLEERGTAYASVIIEPEYRNRIVFEPIFILKPPLIIQHLFIYYPDYICLFHHHHHYHPDFWDQFCCAPAWWSWDTWWCYTWHDQWALWWWYTHPGYPQPYWLTVELSNILPAPLTEVFGMFKNVQKPPIITPNGVVSLADLRESIQRTTGSFTPVLPADPKQLNKVWRLAFPERLEPSRILKPSGRKLPVDPGIRRPQVRKPFITSDYVPKRRIIPEGVRPRIPLKPRLPSHRPSPVRIVPEDQGRPMYPPVRQPTWTPRPSAPEFQPPVRRPPRYYPERQRPGRDEPNDGSEKYPETRWPRPSINRPPIHTTPPSGRWDQRGQGGARVPFPGYRGADDDDDDGQTGRGRSESPRNVRESAPGTDAGKVRQNRNDSSPGSRAGSAEKRGSKESDDDDD